MKDKNGAEIVPGKLVRIGGRTGLIVDVQPDPEADPNKLQMAQIAFTGLQRPEKGSFFTTEGIGLHAPRVFLFTQFEDVYLHSQEGLGMMVEPDPVEEVRREVSPGLQPASVLVLICLLCSLLTGCAGTPNLVNRTLFNVETNWTPAVQVHTVTQTNVITQVNVILQTNLQNQVVQQTNTVQQTNLTVATVTNVVEVPHYTYTDKPAAVSGVETGGGLLGGLWGMGGLASTLALGAYHIYQKSQNKQISGALIQGIETAKEVMKTTPQGQQLAANFQTWLVTHQAAAGVITPIAGLVSDLVNTGQAQGDAQSISGAGRTTAPASKTA